VVPRPDTRRESLGDGVRHLEGLGLVRERLDGDDRPEHLAADDLVALPRPGDHRGLVEVAGTVQCHAPGDDLGVPGQALQQTAYGGELARVGERAEVGVGVVGGSGPQPGGAVGEGVQEGVVDPVVHQDSGGGRAVLTRVVEGQRRQLLHRFVEIGVLVDQHRRVAAEFQVQPLQVGGRRGGDLLSGADTAGDGHQPHLRVGGPRTS
jgi:hypothetical protein